MRTGLIGAVQADNVSVAMTMLRAAGGSWPVSVDKAKEVLPTVKLPGRFQRIETRILDVAHNPDGISRLVETLRSIDVPRPVTAILGVLNDKDWRAMIALLAPCIDDLVLVTPPSAPSQRAWDPLAALAFAREKGIAAEVETGFAAAIEKSRAGTVLITGSFHTVGDALALIG
jgi:dihydrofolate synthase / folylpolyglutamate synthase